MDIYFCDNYGKLYEGIEQGEAVSWKYEGPEGVVKSQFIIREIPMKLNGKTWFDIITPYGYGGPVIEEIKTTKEALVAAYEKAFGLYCSSRSITSEFVRFHPIVGNGLDFQSVYQSDLIRKTIGTNLKDYENPIQQEFSKSCRKKIRQALNKGVTWRVTEAPENLDVFLPIYYSTMDRNNAQDYYYFDEAYFENCLKYFREHLILVEAIFEEKTIAAGLCFVSEQTVHIHLSGTLSEYLYLSPAYILRYAATVWGEEHGYEIVFHGGGRTNESDDPLYTFKKQFGCHTLLDFYVGRKIWNLGVYQKLCVLSGKKGNTDFFPSYRG